jgi:hypothetical protein
MTGYAPSRRPRGERSDHRAVKQVVPAVDPIREEHTVLVVDVSGARGAFVNVSQVDRPALAPVQQVRRLGRAQRGPPRVACLPTAAVDHDEPAVDPRDARVLHAEVIRRRGVGVRRQERVGKAVEDWVQAGRAKQAGSRLVLPISLRHGNDRGVKGDTAFPAVPGGTEDRLASILTAHAQRARFHVRELRIRRARDDQITAQVKVSARLPGVARIARRSIFAASEI